MAASRVQRETIFLISYSGIPEPGRIEAFTVMTDVAPTLLDLTSVDTSPPDVLPMTGRSLLPLITGHSNRVYTPEEPIGIETSGQAAFYCGDYKLVRTMPPHGHVIWRIFNIALDPRATNELPATYSVMMNSLMKDYRD